MGTGISRLPLLWAVKKRNINIIHSVFLISTNTQHVFGFGGLVSFTSWARRWLGVHLIRVSGCNIIVIWDLGFNISNDGIIIAHSTLGVGKRVLETRKYMIVRNEKYMKNDLRCILFGFPTYAVCVAFLLRNDWELENSWLTKTLIANGQVLFLMLFGVGRRRGREVINADGVFQDD